LPIADRHNEAGAETVRTLRAAGVRAQLDDRTESIGRKIRDAELAKVPYMLILGDREAESGTVAVRRHGEGDEGIVPVQEFADRIAAATAARE
ncbi:MAG: threonyl-tRNA synthetase, partial [Baekduia sp.]|nr:threonyl-tRNA synthetase [Baekduia sp.]